MKKVLLIASILVLGLVFAGCGEITNITAPGSTGEEGVVLTKSDFDVECPAAPAVAGLLLEAVGVDNRWGTGKDGGNFIKEVANHMGPETYFDDVDKCDIEEYRLAVAKFLIDQGNGAEKVAELFEAELLSVVYEGICNTFGTNAGDTLTLTFSNNVAFDEEVLDKTLRPEIQFEEANRLSDGVPIWEIVGNTLTLTAPYTFGSARPEIGDYVTDTVGIVDALGNPVIVPTDGVDVEGIVTYPSWTGTWDTEFEMDSTGYFAEMDLIQVDNVVTGTYSWTLGGNIDGTIEGTVEGCVLTGVSTEQNYDYPIVFTINCDGNSFEGEWYSEGQGDPEGYWNGTRVE